MRVSNKVAIKKRIEVWCRNVGFEGTAYGFWSDKIDFADAGALDVAIRTLRQGLRNPLDQAVILDNEVGEQMGFNPHLYASHRVRDVDGWEDVDFKFPPLPPDGTPPPERESG